MNENRQSSDKNAGITRRTFLGATTMTGAGMMLSTAASANKNDADHRKPNIVYVFADQLRAHEVGCYGGKNIETPHMDRLAREGALVSNAISTYPVCSPYRAMLLTGMYPMRNGMLSNDHRIRPDAPAFGEACQAAGYRTAYIGKWHVDGRGRTAYIPPERRMGFEHWMALECTHTYFNSMYYKGDSDEPRYWEGYDAIDQTRAASEFIRQQAADNSPFALFMSWGPPHDPYIAPQEYMEQVDPKTIEVPPNFHESGLADAMIDAQRVNLPENFAHLRNIMRRWLASDEEIRQSYAGYLAATKVLDDCLGELFATLEEAGILDDTIFIFTSDHGDSMGSQRFFGKETPFEESIHIPFLIRYPHKIPANSIRDTLLAPIDVMPTVLGLAEAPCPEVDGLDLSTVLAGEAEDPRDALLIMCMAVFGNATIANGMDAWRGVRTKQHTYARFEDGEPWVLFDNKTDPYQLKNMADSPEHAELRQALEARLDALLELAGDPEDQKMIYDIIARENPNNGMLINYREANPAI